ncbi:hypothetical protein [Streptococcus marimammalium]|uniref:hypothetical protein n=1 Tax=Streptococcus marimammalium TaxID=269666 RepID=UPI00037C0E40|nr:hypothetical protein [Streptococcus marimammalium]
MSIDMYLGHNNAQTNSLASVISKQNNAYEDLQNTLNKFSYNDSSLSGRAYDSAKIYSTSVLIPLLKGCVLLNEAILLSAKNFSNRYISEVSNIDLRESDLRDKIMRADRIVGRYYELLNLEYLKEKPNPRLTYNIRESIYIQQEIKRELEEQLHRLLLFNSSSPYIFSEIEGLASAVQSGLNQAKSSWNSKTQTFYIPKQKEMDWVKKLNHI